MLRDQDLQNYITSLKPVVILLQLGGNDICYSSARPEKVACSIAELMEMLGKIESVQVGVVCELFKRLRPRNIPPQLYEERRKIINNMLPVLLGDLTHKKILFWRHLRLMNSPYMCWVAMGYIYLQSVIRNFTEASDWLSCML